MNVPDTSTSQQPTAAKAEPWGIFFAIATASQFVALVGYPNIAVPPRISQQLDKVEVGVVFLCIPFIASLFMLFRYHGKSERVIAYGSLATSLLWLAAAASLIEQALSGP